MLKRYRTRCSKVIARIGFFVGLVLLCTGAVQAQPEDSPEFEVDAISARSSSGEGLTRVDLYVQIPYEQLSFINTSEGFRAQYDVTVEVATLDDRNRPTQLVQTRIWERTVTTATFISTRSGQLFDYSTQSVELSPGRYLLTFQVEDQETSETFVREVAVQVRDLDGEVAVSDLILIRDFDQETNTIVPNVSSRIPTDQFGIKLFYEVYAERDEEVRITREVFRIRKGDSGLPVVGALLGGGDRVEEGMRTYTNEVLTELQPGRNQTVVEIVMDDLAVGDYVVRVKVEDEHGRVLDTAEKTFTAQWTGLAEHISDLDEAIDQLQYIAKDRQLRYIKDGATKAERLNRFQEFWEKRDPTPGTERNERMEEYYYRIAYANREYGSLAQGWKTDRGHVVVLFGEPDYVERHPYNFDVKPYEVWFYYRLGRQFIFVDETGFGDYELMVPIWDERTRIR